MQYRREIDGLRALAVLPVILFHAGFETFSGGFVGVDVFFVISGYLITTIIINELDDDKFSIINFYERRARRILPALFVVMLACLPFAWMWLLPSDMKDFSQSLVAVSLFASNILFWRESGYFAAAAELKPLLHTWSLAVEEQYYVLFPIFLLLTWRFGRRFVIATLAVIAIISLGLAEWGSTAKPAATFYLLPTRGWELLLGAFTAFYLSSHAQGNVSAIVKEIGSLLGLFLVLYSVFYFDASTPFPSLYTLAPTIGTVLIIALASNESLVGKILGWKIFVGIGLISYSAYLWHQPLFAFARHLSLTEPHHDLLTALAIATFILAYITWKFIESPFRNKNKVSKHQIFYFSASLSLAWIAIGAIGHVKSDIYYLETDREHLVGIDYRLRVNHGLHSDCEGNFNNSENCQTADEPEIMIWGDSYAMHLVSGILASKSDVKIVQKTKSVCGPFLDVSPTNKRYPIEWAKGCLDFNQKVLHYLESSPSIKYVVLGSPYGQFLGSEDFRLLKKNGEVVLGEEYALSAMRKTLAKIIEIGKTPILFSPPPSNGHNIGRCLVKAIQFNKPLSDCDIKGVETTQNPVKEFLTRLDEEFDVVWLEDFLCENKTCRASLDNIFIYRDGGHLSHEGSAALGRYMGFYERIKKITQNTNP